MVRSHRDLVRRVAQLLTSDASLEDDDLSCRLRSEGFSLADAERAIAFVPIAFGRRCLAADPPEYQPGFEIRDLDSGRSKSSALADEPLYRAAEEEAVAWQIARSQDEFLRVATRSAELGVVLQLTQDGSRPSDLVLTEPVFLRIPIE
jgi:hypothetical protein